MVFTDRLSGRFRSFSAPLQGALYMTAAALCFAFMNVLVREGAAELHPVQVVFFRNFFALLFMLPWLARVGAKGLKTQRLGMHGWRAVVGLTAMFCWFSAVTLNPLAEAVALNFTLPLFVTAAAALFLPEKVGLRRWGATFVGFLGMLIILRPGFAEVSAVTSLPIIAAVFMAGSVIILKSLSGTENPNAVVLYMNLFMTPLSLIPALFFWSWPSWTVLGYMALLGFIAMLAHLALTRAYVKADASAVMPFDYMRLPFVALLAWFLYGEVADGFTWLGALVIAASALYIARRESQLAKLQAATETAAKAPQGRAL